MMLVEMLLRDRDWAARAKCAGRDPADYELEPLHGGTRESINRNQLLKQARAHDLCLGCPVIAECAKDALETKAHGMVRGGVWVSASHGEKDIAEAAKLLLEKAAAPLLKEDE